MSAPDALVPTPDDDPTPPASEQRPRWRRILGHRVPLGPVVALAMVGVIAALVALGVAASDLDDERREGAVIAEERDALAERVTELEEDVADRDEDVDDAEAERDDALEAAEEAETAALAKAEADLAARVAELDQREAAVAAREVAVTQTEVERDQNSFGNGVWEVGVDIQAGKYKTGGSGDCYWEKTSASGDIIDNDLPNGPTTVVIESSVFTFSSQRCGEWTKVG